MELINGKMRLNAVAKILGVSSGVMRYHLYNASGLGNGACQLGVHETAEWLVSKEGVTEFLQWARNKSRKIKLEAIEALEKELNATKFD